MAEKGWFKQAQDLALGVGKGVARAVGAGSGLLAGAASEVGRFAEDVAETTKKGLGEYDPTKTFPELVKGIRDVKEGRIDLTKAPGAGGKEKAIQGLLGPQGPTGPQIGEEAKYKDSPLYEASKRDLLNIGEGLVELAGLASGLGEGEKLKQARKEEEGKKAPDLIKEAVVAGKAGFRTGEEIAGGLIATPVILGSAFMGEEGRKLYREAPITTLMNALPVLGGVLKGIKAGRYSAIQIAEFNKAAKKAGFANMADLEAAVSRGQAAVGNVQKALSEGVKQAAKPIGTGAAPVSRLVRGAVELTEKAGSVGIPVAALAQVSPEAAAVVGGAYGLVKAAPLLAKYRKAAPVAAAVKKAERKAVEPRTYETATAAEQGEALLRAEGETQAAGTMLEGLDNDLAFNALPEPTELQPKPRFPGQTTNRNPNAIPIIDNQVLQVGEDGASVIRKDTGLPDRYVQFDKTGPGNTDLFVEVRKRLQPLGIDNTLIQKAYNIIAAADKAPILSLADDGVKNAVADAIVQQVPENLRKPGLKASVLRSLDNLKEQAYNFEGQEPMRLVTPKAELADGTSINITAIIEKAERTLGVDPINIAKKAITDQILKTGRKTALESVGNVGGAIDQAATMPMGQAGNSLFSEYNKLVAEGTADTAGIGSMKTSPAKAIEVLDRELARQGELPDVPEGYYKFISRLRDEVAGLKQSPEGVYVQPSVAELPRLTTYSTDIPEVQSAFNKLVSGAKRLTTTYNPLVILGNYMGNAIVESMATGKNPIRVIGEQVDNGFQWAKRIEEAKRVGQLALEDELVLRAVPKANTAQLVETGNASIFTGEIPFVGKGIKAVETLYENGDVYPKLLEASTKARELISGLEALPNGEFAYLRTGPNQLIAIQKRGKAYTVINPQNGKILTSGDINKPAIKRILAGAVKQATDAKFPDVREIPAWFRALSKNDARAIVFSPFLSYVVKAADSPFRRGILSNLIDLDNNPIAFTTSKTIKPSITNIADQLLSKKVASYFRSRGLINSMGARFNTLSSEERDQLRTMFSFAPSQVKPLIFGKVFELEDNQAVTTSSPSYATFWSMTDSYIRAIPGIINLAKTLTGKKEEVLLKELGTDNPLADKVVMELAQNKQPTIADTAQAVGIAGGLLLPLFLKVTKAGQLGEKELKAQDFTRPFGVIGRVVNEFIPEKEEDKVRFAKPYEKAKAGLVKFVDVMLGTQMNNPTIPSKQVIAFMNRIYGEVWTKLIQPLERRAAVLEAEGNEDEADRLLEQADEINELLKEAIDRKIESYNNTIIKLGMDKEELGLNDVRYRNVKSMELPTIETLEEPVEEETPKEEE